MQGNELTTPLQNRNAGADYLRPEDGDWHLDLHNGEIVCDLCLHGAERTVPPNHWLKLSTEGGQQLRIAEPVHPDGWEAHWRVPLRCHRCGRQTLPCDVGDYFERTDYTKVPITEEALERATTSH